MENWKPIPGYEGLYDVSDQGRLRSWWMNGKIMRGGSSNGRGYLQVNLTDKEQNKRRYYVHRLVLIAFIGVEGRHEANHKNGNKTDNRLENLEWITRSENHKHRHDVLGHTSPMKGRLGAAHPCAKTYIVTHPNGDTEIITGLSAFCRRENIDVSGMYLVMSGKQKTHRGFKCEPITKSGVDPA